MIRFISQSLGMAVVAALFGTGVALTAARGQNGFVDDESHVPPSPGGQMSARLPYYQTASAVEFVPPATVTYPVQSSSSVPPSPARNLTPIQFPATRAMASPGTYGAGMKMTPKPGAYGAGGKRPDPRATAADMSRRVTPVTHTAPASTATTRPASAVTPASHYGDVSESAFPPSVPPPLGSPPAPLLPRFPMPTTAPNAPYPTERLQAPSIRGSHLGLLPGETATEQSMRLKNMVYDRDQQIEGLSQQNSELSQMVKQRDDQLLLAIREIKGTRKEVQNARDELENLRQQVKALQEKVQGAERDNAALIQTMAPLLRKLLESNDDSSNSLEE